MQPDHILDAGETGCGELTLLIFQTIKQIEPGQTLEVHAYDLAAAMDIPAWCRSTGNMLVTVDANSHPKRFLIRKSAAL
jgi:tRNA 2-thiouridine synthesizing protein A